MNTTSHQIREAVSHLEDLELEEVGNLDLDMLHAAAYDLIAAVEAEWTRRDRGEQ